MRRILHHKTSLSELRPSPLSIQDRVCPLLPALCESLHTEIEAMSTDEGMGPVMLYFFEPGQLERVEPAAPAFQRHEFVITELRVPWSGLGSDPSNCVYSRSALVHRGTRSPETAKAGDWKLVTKKGEEPRITQ